MDKTTEAWLQSIAEKIPRAYANGVEEGKRAEHEDFWNNHMGGNMYYMHGRYAGMGWNKKTFRPTEDLDFTGANCQYCFYYNGCRVDLVEWCKQLGINIIVKPSFANYMFANSQFTRLPVLDFSELSALSNTLTNCSYLVTVDLFKIRHDGNTDLSNAFNGCTALENILFEGIISKTANFKDCHKLTKASIESIMNHLSTTATFTVTLSQTAVNNAFATEEWQAIINAKPTNVTISLV